MDDLSLPNRRPVQLVVSSNGLYGFGLTSGYPSGEPYYLNLATGANTIVTSFLGTYLGGMVLAYDNSYAYITNTDSNYNNYLKSINLATSSITTTALGYKFSNIIGILADNQHVYLIGLAQTILWL